MTQGLEEDENIDNDAQPQPLPQDDGTPVSLPTDPLDDPSDSLDHEANARLDKTHPTTDTNLQTEEAYDEGMSGAAEAEEPNAGNTVAGYDPGKDERRSNQG